MPRAEPLRAQFGLIERYLSHLGAQRDDVQLGVGDDAALINPLRNAANVDAGVVQVRTDCVHVNLHKQSLARVEQNIASALTALTEKQNTHHYQCAWISLCLSLPNADEALLATITKTMHAYCSTRAIAVVGGDTTGGDASLLIFANAFAR